MIPGEEHHAGDFGYEEGTWENHNAFVAERNKHLSGFIIEYVTNGFPTIEVQLGAAEANWDPTREVLSIWAFEDADECAKIIGELRDFRIQLLKGKHERSTKPDVQPGCQVDRPKTHGDGWRHDSHDLQRGRGGCQAPRRHS